VSIGLTGRLGTLANAVPLDPLPTNLQWLPRKRQRIAVAVSSNGLCMLTHFTALDFSFFNASISSSNSFVIFSHFWLITAHFSSYHSSSPQSGSTFYVPYYLHIPTPCPSDCSMAFSGYFLQPPLVSGLQIFFQVLDSHHWSLHMQSQPVPYQSCGGMHCTEYRYDGGRNGRAFSS